MRPLRYSINVTLDGCCDHRAGIPDEELHRHAVENLRQADALLFGRVTYQMMEAAFRRPAPAGARQKKLRNADCGTLRAGQRRVDGQAAPGARCEVGDDRASTLAELGLIDEYEFVVHPRLAGHGPTLFAGLSKRVDLKLVSRLEFGSGAVAMRYEPRR